MKLGIDAMRLNRYGHKPARKHLLNWLRRPHLSQRASDDAHDFLIVTIDDGGNEAPLCQGNIGKERQRSRLPLQ